MAQSPLRLLIDNLKSLTRNIEQLTELDVLVGVPSENTNREETGPTNAMLAYVHDNGSPARNIPARPFMRPGLEAAKDLIAEHMRAGAQAALQGENNMAVHALDEAGLVAQNAIRAKINEGILPPLKPDTIKNRRKARGTKSRRKSEEQYLQDLANGIDSDTAFSNSGIKPLINTGQLRNSITYAIRRKQR